MALSQRQYWHKEAGEEQGVAGAEADPATTLRKPIAYCNELLLALCGQQDPYHFDRFTLGSERVKYV